MENKFNYCGGSNMMRKKIKLQEATANFIEMKKQKEAAEAQRLEEAQTLNLMNQARYSATSSYTRGKERAKNLQESLQYREKTTKNTMAEYITKIVENSLLIDKEEYAALNPNYLKECKDLVVEFLENANLNESIKKKETLTIMEHVARNIPKTETGILLSEAEITGLVTKAENAKVEGAIDDLSTQVMDKVSALVGKEQEKQIEIQKDLDEIVKLSEASKAKNVNNASKVAPPAEEEVPEEAVEELPTEEEEMPVEEDVPMDATPRKETSIEIAPDGKIKIKTITEDAPLFVNEIPKQGLLETLAVNEGMKMIAEGKDYNGDLALAKALTYVTVLETFNTMGLLEFSEQKQRELVRLGGGVEYTQKKYND